MLEFIKVNSNVCLFVGSADPFHIGHLEIANIICKLVDYLLIVPNNPNKNKPDRSELKHRLAIIKTYTFPNNVYVCSEDVKDITKELINKKCNMYGIIGSDQLGSKLHIPPDKWFVVPRDFYEIDNNKLTLDMIVLDKSLFKNQSYSSTLIRNLFFTGIKGPDISIEKLISRDAHKYITENKLYCRSRIVRDFVKHTFGNMKLKYIKNNVVELNKQYIIKIFNTETDYNNEIKSYDIIKNFGFDIKIPKIISYVNKSFYWLLVLSYDGECVGDYLDACTDNEKIFNISKTIGQMLKKLHEHRQFRTVDPIDKHHKKLKKIKLDCSKYIRNSGTMSYVHGDAWLNNFVINDKGNITMIDFSGINKYGQMGIPAYEYYQFLSSLSFYEYNNIELISKGFITGYGDTYFTSEADELFKTHWSDINKNMVISKV